MAPWYETDNQIQTIVPGQQSAVYPDAPLGLVFPGDTGISRGLSPTRFGNLSPRLGVAYSPNEKTSLRASYGLFYTAFQGLSAGIMYGVPPYGYNYLSPAPPLVRDAVHHGRRRHATTASGFRSSFRRSNASPSNPVTNIDLSQFLPVNADPFFGDDEQDAVFGELHGLDAARAGAEHGRRRSATSARAATTCWCCSRPIPAIRRCA